MVSIVPIAIATEDELSEAIALRLIQEVTHTAPTVPYHVTQQLRRGGFGYLKSRMDSWHQMAAHQIMLVLTDLDTADCAPTLRSDWLAQRTPHPFLLLRIAVREVEAWALADHEALRQLMGTKGKLPPTPDELPDPKQTLLTLAKLAPKRIRDDLLRVDPHGQLRQGIGYNAQLTRWVQHTWNPSRAAARSPSLQRALKRLHDTGHAFATGHHHVP